MAPDENFRELLGRFPCVFLRAATVPPNAVYGLPCLGLAIGDDTFYGLFPVGLELCRVLIDRYLAVGIYGGDWVGSPWGSDSCTRRYGTS